MCSKAHKAHKAHKALFDVFVSAHPLARAFDYTSESIHESIHAYSRRRDKGVQY